LLATRTIAEALGVSDRSVRLYAQSGRIPFSVTPGGHRRFDIDEVTAALATPEPRIAPKMTVLRRHRKRIMACAAEHGAHNVRVFGSVAAGSADTDSDVDLLVALDHGRTYADIDNLEADLRALLSCDVDVLTEGACHGRFAHVLDQAIPL